MYKIYQVEYKDTLQSIASMVGTTVEELININGFDGDEELVAGNLMIVPNNKNNIFEKYTVNNGETIYSIAKMYNLDPETLLLINGLNKNDFIYPNQQIMVPSGNYNIYITKEGDTLNKVLSVLNIDINSLLKDNEKILLLDNQLILSRNVK